MSPRDARCRTSSRVSAPRSWNRFIEETIGVTRVTIAEADRFPALSRHVHEHGRDRAAAAVSHVLNDATHALSRGSKGPFGPKRSGSTAQIFMDLILLPMMMRALMGEGEKELRSELPAFVTRTRQLLPGGL